MTTHATRTARTTPRPSLLPSPLALAAALLLAGTGAPAQAQVGDEPGMGSGTPQLREVVITSRRTLEERFMATGSMVVVDRQDMENMGVDSAADVLRQLPGLQVGTNANGNVEVRMRGMDARSTRVLIDGQSASSSGPLTLDQLPVDLIERIEVVRSPSAEFSGSGGGTVNIVLRQASRERSTMFRLTDGIAWGQHTGRLWLARTAPLDNTPPEDRTAPTWSSFSGLWLAEQLMGSDTERTQTTNGQVSEEIESRNRTQRQDWWLVQRINGRIGRDQLNLRATLSGSLGDGRFETRSGGSTQVQTADTQRQNWQLGGDWTRRLAIGKLETTLSGSNQDDEQLRQGGTR